MIHDHLAQDAILRIGEVSAVEGRRIIVKVDKEKNSSDIFFNGDILKNISVNNFIEIRKGYLSIIGKVEGERIQEDFSNSQYEKTNRSKRFLTVSLVGFISNTGGFTGGTKELPLVGNEAFIVTKDKIHSIHNLVEKDGDSITIATSDNDGFNVDLPIDKLFNSHIAIFGNTGSGKSNTLAFLFQELTRKLHAKNPDSFRENCKFLLFDFNGEYINPNCITSHKTVLNLSTRGQGDKIPLSKDELLNIEVLSILSDATEKTQKPFLKRAINFYQRVFNSDEITNPEAYLKGIMRAEVHRILQMTDKEKAFLAIDYFKEILPPIIRNDVQINLVEDLDWHGSGYKIRANNSFLQQYPTLIPTTQIFQHIDNYQVPDNFLSLVVNFLHIQLIDDILSGRTQNEHVSPVINKFRSKMADVEKVFDISGNLPFWATNFVIVNLNAVNLEMKKTIPLLLSKKLYQEQKDENRGKILNIIIDEAHNILSHESFRESESWKDYRLETFEEIIKEGRKFGVFITISSQRPNDISSTITSQAHNYFIHRLINQRDLETISKAVSYIDRITEESIPTLPTGTCIFSGVASQMPMKLNVKELPEENKPNSRTIQFKDVVKLDLLSLYI